MRISDWSSDVCSSDLGGAQKKKLLDPSTAGRMNDVELVRQVVVQEACGRTGVGMNATDLRRSQKYRLRTAFPDPFLDGVLPCQVQFIAGRSQDGAVFLAQAAKDRPAHHATMARNPNPLPSQVIHSPALR